MLAFMVDDFMDCFWVSLTLVLFAVGEFWIDEPNTPELGDNFFWLPRSIYRKFYCTIILPLPFD